MQGFQSKPLKERFEILKRNKLCFRCCSLKRHTQNKCRETIKCDICNKSDHPSGLHVSNDQGPRKTSHDKGANVSEHNNRHGGEYQPSVISSCTHVCGDNRIYSKSCAKIIQVYVYHENNPTQARIVYALIDDQSNYSLGKPEFFDSFNDNSEYVNFTLSPCSGKTSSSGRKGSNYVVEPLDHSVKIKIPSLVECTDIPNNRHEIPSPEVVANFSHLRDLASCIPPIDNDIQIELLIGRDVLRAHHVLEQRLGGDDLPYAHRLPLGWENLVLLRHMVMI